MKIDVRGDLAGILTIALDRKGAPATKALPKTQISRRESPAADLIEQVKMVAGARIGRERHSLITSI